MYRVGFDMSTRADPVVESPRPMRGRPSHDFSHPLPRHRLTSFSYHTDPCTQTTVFTGAAFGTVN
jgi:hypothetical protein